MAIACVQRAFPRQFYRRLDCSGNRRDQMVGARLRLSGPAGLLVPAVSADPSATSGAVDWRMARPDAHPPARLISWVEHTLGGGVRVIQWRRLTGGLTSIVHHLSVNRSGIREECVLRWWVANSESEQWIARAVPQETAVLMMLEGKDIPAPRVIGSTTDAALGGPALLMSCVPGESRRPLPRGRAAWSSRHVAEPCRGSLPIQPTEVLRGA
jgi:hypothetical protein